MKKKVLAVMFAMSMMALASACGAQPETEVTETEVTEEVSETTEETQDVQSEAVVEEEDMGAYPANDFEARVGKTEFESYDEIIGLLEGDEAYTYANVKGYDGQVLLITSATYDNLDGNFATTECTFYSMKPNGTCTADSMLFSGGTANPLAIDEEGIIYAVTHSSVEKDCYGENGTDSPALMVLAYAYIDEYDDNGNAKTVSGFIRTENTVVDNEGEEIAADDVEAFDKLMADYGKTSVIGFTRVNDQAK